MIYQLNKMTTYKFLIKHKTYYVLITSIKNTYCGQPRYEAIITRATNDNYTRYSYKYRFNGHYFGEKKEALFILKHHLSK